MRNSVLSDPEKLHIARERFLRFVVDGQRDTTEADIQCRIEKLEISNWGPLFAVAEISLHMDMYPASYLDSTLLRIEEAVLLFLKNSGWTFWSYIDSRNSLIVILCADEAAAFAGLDASLAKLVQKLMAEFGVVIYAGIGGVVSVATDIRYSAKEANTCIMYKYTAARNNVIHIKNIKQILSNSATDNTTAFDRIIGCFMDGDLQKLNIRLNELLAYLSKSRSSMQIIRQAYLELLTQILHRAADAGIKLDEEQTSEHLQYVLRECDAQQLKNWFLEICSDYIRRMGLKRQESTTHIAEIAKQFVERNYADSSLSQQTVSDHLGLSVGYFGQLFFSQTGQRFVDYLQHHRLEIARKYLLTSNDKIKDISTLVGFTNVNYFNSLFKKYYDITPKEFRTQRQ